MLSKARVLICDDSALVRQFLMNVLSSAPGVEVCGQACDGDEAVRMTLMLHPDVITMDVEMPRTNGIEAVRRIMKECPTPILMLSSLTTQGSRVTIEALEAGALDFIGKPSQGQDLRRIGGQIAEKVLQLAERGRRALVQQPAAGRRWSGRLPERTPLVVIGSSTGGPRALFQVVPALPEGLPAAVIVVQHMPPGFTRSLADRLDASSPLPVHEVERGEHLAPGTVFVAQAGRHLSVQGAELQLTDTPPVHGVRPAVDVTLLSAASTYRGPIVAAILTGMGRDGTDGALAVRAAGGTVLAESERTALIYGMPRSVVEAGAADSIQDLDQMAREIVHRCEEIGHVH